MHTIAYAQQTVDLSYQNWLSVAAIVAAILTVTVYIAMIVVSDVSSRWTIPLVGAAIVGIVSTMGFAVAWEISRTSTLIAAVEDVTGEQVLSGGLSDIITGGATRVTFPSGTALVEVNEQTITIHPIE